MERFGSRMSLPARTRRRAKQGRRRTHALCKIVAEPLECVRFVAAFLARSRLAAGARLSRSADSQDSSTLEACGPRVYCELEVLLATEPVTSRLRCSNSVIFLAIYDCSLWSLISRRTLIASSN
jgi:hypothetical protein